MGEPSELAPSIAHGKMHEVVAADDERLVQMGYNQVSELRVPYDPHWSNGRLGVQTGVHQTLHIIVRDIHYGSAGFRASNICPSTRLWRSRDGYLDLVRWKLLVHDGSPFR